MGDYSRRIKVSEKNIHSRIGHIDIELTERCNNDCIHCCINLAENDHSASLAEMATEKVKEYLKQAAELGCMQVRFTGGEPLLRKDFIDLYLTTRKLGMKVMLFTNARLIDNELVDLFTRIPPLAKIEVTVYGMHQKSYESVTRVPGSFEQFWRGVNLLLEHNIPFVVKSALLPPNKAEMEEFETWAATIPWMDDSPGYAMFLDLRNRRDNDRKNEVIKRLRISPAEGVSILARDREKYTRGMNEFAAKYMGPCGDQLFNCGAGNSVSIDAYGRIQPCMGIRSPELTKPAGTKLNEALDAFSHLSEMKATNPEYLARCGKCALKGLCEQCPAKSWAETGTLDTPVEYLCEITHTQARYMGWLVESENGWEEEFLA